MMRGAVGLVLTALSLLASAEVPLVARSYPGELRSGDRWTVAFDVGGVVGELAVRVGEDVTPGRVLARLDPGPFDARVAEAEARHGSAQAHWTHVTETIDPVQLRAYSPSITTDLDLGPLRVAVLEAELGVGTAGTELRHARWARSAADVAANRPGRVVRWLVAEGGAVAAGQAVVVLEDRSAPEVVVRVSRTMAGRLRRGQRAEIVSGNGERFDGYIRSIARAEPPGNGSLVTVGFRERRRPADDGPLTVRFQAW